MSKEEFKALFEHELEVAAEHAETKLGRPVPRMFEIEMHGLATHSRLLKKDDAFDEIYLGPDLFYQIIDLAVRRVSKDVCTVFVGISGHAPGPLSQTWNHLSGRGPFKQVLANEVELI